MTLLNLEEPASLPKEAMRVFVGLATLTLNAFVIAKLWLWFLVPALNVKPISTPVAYGLWVLVSMFTHQLSQDLNVVESERSKDIRLASMILRPLASLLCGWVALQFISTS